MSEHPYPEHGRPKLLIGTILVAGIALLALVVAILLEPGVR